MIAATPMGAVDFVIGQPSTATFYGTFGGFGAEWDPMFWNTYNQSQGCTPADWDLIVSRVEQMRVPIVRMMFQVYWCCTDPNLVTWTWTSQQMQSVYRYLDVCQANGIDVVLTDWGWGAQRWHNPRLVDSPDDIRFARAIAMYLEELIVNRGYTCIKYFVCGNEPDNEIVPRYSLDVYYRMYRNIHQELTARGIRDRVKLTGPDMGGQWDFFKNFISSMQAIVGAYDFHRYSPFNETSNIGITYDYEALWPMMDMWRGEVSARDPAGAGKPILLTEFGGGDGGTFTHPMIDTYDYALHMADYGTTLLTTRVNAAMAWCMHDTYMDWNQRMVWGIWRYKDAGWQLRPWAHTYALLTRHAHRGSVQCPVNGSPPAHPGLTPHRCAALRRPDDTWAVFLVNRTTTSAQFNVSLPSAPRYPLVQYVVDWNTYAQYTSSVIVPAVSTVAVGRNLSLMLGASSFMVLSETTVSSSAKRLVVTVSGVVGLLPDGVSTAAVTATITDGSGMVVASATDTVTFSVIGPGSIRPPSSVPAFGGSASVVYQAGTSSGTVAVTAAAPGVIAGQYVFVVSSRGIQRYHTLTLRADPPHGGSVIASPPASMTYLSGTTVTLTAVAQSGYQFQAWNISAESAPLQPRSYTVNPMEMLITEDLEATAVFVPVEGAELSSGGVRIIGGPDGYINAAVNPNVTIRFRRASVGVVTVRIYDLRGRLVLEKTKDGVAGIDDDIAWNAAELPAGVYIVRVKGGGVETSRRVVVVH